MKITIENEGVIVTIEDKNAVTLDESIQLIDQCLKGVGFVYGGSLEISEHQR